MRVELPKQDSGTVRLYVADAMADEYEPPGVKVQRNDDGVRYLRVTEAVGTALIDRHGYEELGADENE